MLQKRLRDQLMTFRLAAALFFTKFGKCDGMLQPEITPQLDYVCERMPVDLED